MNIKVQHSPVEKSDPIPPPDDFSEIRPGDWIPLDGTHPIISYINSNFWAKANKPVSWEGARYSRAVYLYRESGTRWTLVVKFYQPKTGLKAEQYAERERQMIEQVRSAGFSSGDLRAVEPLGAWRGVLYLEYVKGFTLADMIAVRRSQPGVLQDSMQSASKFLANLHSSEIIEQALANPDQPIAEALKYLSTLEKHGVLKGEAEIADALKRQIDNWCNKPIWNQYTPALCHGDATTTNFVFPSQGEIVAIDWERMKTGDPAADFGRLAAEISYTLNYQGAQGNEITDLIKHLQITYSQASSPKRSDKSFFERARFYQASSTLRIARNGWIPRTERMYLVTQAMALLA